MNFKVSPMKPFGILVEPSRVNQNVDSLDLQVLRNLFQKNQILLLRGFSTFTHAEEFANYCEKWGEISVWPFGKVLELREHQQPEDHIFDHRYVPLHWDGMYRPQIPEFQIFHCVKAPLPGHGGRTTFSNTLMVLQRASHEEKLLWSKVTGNYHRKMEFYHSKTISPIITKHPYRDCSVIRYNEPPTQDKGQFVNPPDLHFTGISESELQGFHDGLRYALYNPLNFYAHEWQENDIVISDNFSLLHGREGFVSKSPRHLQRVHVLSNPPFDNPGLEEYR